MSQSRDEELELPERCPNCGKPSHEWTTDDGKGVVSGGVVYCSEGCAVEDAARQHED